MAAVLALCAGFLLAVLWFDLMFDVQVLGRGRGADPLPEEVLASIAAYYRRVTTQARPMNYLVGVVMLVTAGGTLIGLFRGVGSAALRLLSLALCGIPIVAATARTVANAVRLGSRPSPPDVQSPLAPATRRDVTALFRSLQAFAP